MYRQRCECVWIKTACTVDGRSTQDSKVLASSVYRFLLVPKVVDTKLGVVFPDSGYGNPEPHRCPASAVPQKHSTSHFSLRLCTVSPSLGVFQFIVEKSQGKKTSRSLKADVFAILHSIASDQGTHARRHSGTNASLKDSCLVSFLISPGSPA